MFPIAKEIPISKNYVHWCIIWIISFVPPGLAPFWKSNPRLKPWAIFFRPAGFRGRPKMRALLALGDGHRPERGTSHAVPALRRSGETIQGVIQAGWK
jgi:hypothetical protein